MKLFIVFIFFSSITFAQWSQEIDFPELGRDDAVAASVNNKIYFGTGRDENFACRNDWWEFDPETNLWKELNPLPAKARQYSEAFTLNNKIYVVCGITCNNEFLKEVWEFNPKENLWSKKNDFPGIGRSSAIHFIWNNEAYFGTGRNGDHYLNDLWKYNQQLDNWEKIIDFPFQKRYEMACFEANSKVYLGLGRLEDGSLSNNWYEFNPINNQTIVKQNVPFPERYYTAHINCNGKGYLSTGMCSVPGVPQEFSNNIWEYNPENDTWNKLAEIPSLTKRRGCAFASIKESIYIINGLSEANQRIREIWSFKTSEKIIDKNWSIYPNPCEEKILIQFDTKENNIVKIEMFDWLGKIVYACEINFPISEHLILVSNFKKGYYFIKIKDNKGKESIKKVIKI